MILCNTNFIIRNIQRRYRKKELTLCMSEGVILKLTEVTIGGTTAFDSHLKGSWPACIALVLNPHFDQNASFTWRRKNYRLLIYKNSLRAYVLRINLNTTTSLESYRNYTI